MGTPTTPTSPAATTNAPGQATVAWTPGAESLFGDVTGWVIEQSTDNGATWAPATFSSADPTGTTVTGLTNGTSHRFRVAGVNVVGTGGFATTAAVTPPLPPAPPAPPSSTPTPTPPAPPTPTPPAPAVVPLTPIRVLDTRQPVGVLLDAPAQLLAQGPVAGGRTVVVDVRRAALPAGATVAAVNLTVTNAATPGFLVVHRCGEPLPATSNLNFQARVDRAGFALAPLDSAGNICVFTTSTTELIVDVVGYVPATSSYRAVTPVRLGDTRSSTALVPGATLRLTPPASTATALAITVTSTRARAAGFIVAYSCAAGLPPTSTVNFVTGRDRANSTIVANGDICISTSAVTDVIVDLHGEFGAGIVAASNRLLDTRIGTPRGPVRSVTIDPATIPALAGRSRAFVNVTAVGAVGNTFLTIWNCADPRPNASVLNAVPGEAIANLTLVDTTRPICIDAFVPTDVIVDLVAVAT